MYGTDFLPKQKGALAPGSDPRALIQAKEYGKRLSKLMVV